MRAKNLISGSRNKAVLAVMFIQFLIMTALFVYLVLTGKDYADYLLRDDGYYRVSGNFAKGIFNSGSVIGPGLPLIYAPIHFFDKALHPFIRLLISQLAVLTILYAVSQLTVNYLDSKQLFFGLLMVIVHPVFIQWSFRTSVDLYLAAFMGIIVLFLMKYLTGNKIRYLLFSIAFFSYSIFIKPSFIFIPPLLFAGSWLLLKSRKMIAVSLVLVVVAAGCFMLNSAYLKNNAGSNEITASEERNIVLLYNLVLTQTIIETGEFHKGTVEVYDKNKAEFPDQVFDKGVFMLDFKVKKFINEYKAAHPGRGMMNMVLYYVKENPEVLPAKIFLGPVFFFSLASRELVSYLLLFISVIYFIMVVYGIRSIVKNRRIDPFFIILFSILAGYFLLHWVTHAYSRYSIVVIPFLYVWGGPVVYEIIKTLRLKRSLNIK